MPAHTPTQTHLTPLFNAVAQRARLAGVFASVDVQPAMLECAALNPAAPAFYRLFPDAGRLWVAFATPDRWLSQSIEADLVHTGDNLGELIDEELVDQGYRVPKGSRTPFEHFRDDQKVFVFRTPVPVALDRASDPASAELGAQFLLAYEACFRNLGDVDAGDDDE